ncbi:MAG: DUF1501 domain-containing protein [Burkholderiaceae bacterium]|jgi:uncharacterized protein (DUF1501 family)|nr:DUF1501 domain-containing protein [Burkholderiaceae bacterium]
MQRRRFLSGAAAVSAYAWAGWARAEAPPPRLLVLIELRGGNDGLNTVLPADIGRYRDLRPRLALAEDGVAALTPQLRVHRSLAPLQALWDAGELAVLQGVGYPQPNLSHFRSIEIWDTASASTQTLTQGWLTRVTQADARFASFAADGVVVGAPDLGPLGGGARAVAVADPARFARAARLAHDDAAPATGAMAHLLRVEADIVRAGTQIRPQMQFATAFPRGAFGLAVQHAAGIAATRRVPVLRLTLGGFDTHSAQLPRQAELLRQLAEGMVALRAALVEAGLWQQTLLLTYSEFGRRPRENGTGGTDHGTAGVHFAAGGAVRGGMLGEPAPLDRLDRDGNLPHAIDFRAIYASVLEQWWQIDSARALGGRFATLSLLRS